MRTLQKLDADKAAEMLLRCEEGEQVNILAQTGISLFIARVRYKLRKHNFRLRTKFRAGYIHMSCSELLSREGIRSDWNIEHDIKHKDNGNKHHTHQRT